MHDFADGELYRSYPYAASESVPLLLICDGWIDASDAMAMVARSIVDDAGLETVAEFNPDILLDHRARRPSVRLIDGVPQKLEWPQILLSAGHDLDGQPFLVLHGPEPDFHWRPFCSAVAAVASSVGAGQAYILGAYPAPVPHTRPTRISTTGSTGEMLGHRPRTVGEITVAAGIHLAISEELRSYEIETLGLWAQVPYYLSTSSWPQAPAGLLRDLTEVAGLAFNYQDLEQLIPQAQTSVEQSVEDNPALTDIIGDLEARFDDMRQVEERNLPSGDEIEAQVQQYLRKIDDD